jgi:hypothetical protein
MMGQKNMSDVGRNLVSILPYDNAQNKNVSLVVHSVVVLGSQKDGDSVLIKLIIG